MYWNLIWKSPGFVPFVANLTHFWPQSDIRDVDESSAIMWYTRIFFYCLKPRLFWEVGISLPVYYYKMINHIFQLRLGKKHKQSKRKEKENKQGLLVCIYIIKWKSRPGRGYGCLHPNRISISILWYSWLNIGSICKFRVFIIWLVE